MQNFNELQKYVRNLPSDIQNYILSYTYSPQSKPLVDDICHFFESRKFIHKLYYDRWHHEYPYEPDADHNWFDNDLIGYMNENQATMVGYTKRMYNIFYRHYGIYSKIHRINPLGYDENLLRRHLSRLIGRGTPVRKSNNIKWGLLTIEERDEFTEIETFMDLEN
jgi:hypothetical protein